MVAAQGLTKNKIVIKKKKVYQNFAYIVADANGHGMQVSYI